MSNDNKKHPYRTDWRNFDTCCLDISLFNRYQEGHYLASMYNWVSERFSRAIINLGDGLHRHNLQHQFSSADQAHKAANTLGAQWIKSNEGHLSYMTIPHELLRSDDWLAHPDFDKTHEALWEYYYNNAAFKEVVRTDIDGFVARRKDLPADMVRRASLYYLLEETAADIVLGRSGGVAHLYPGGRHGCYGYLVEQAMAGALPQDICGLENSAFKRLSPSRISLRKRDTTTKAGMR